MTLRSIQVFMIAALATSRAWAEPDLTQVQQDFSDDPGWDHYQNRVVGTGMPLKVQDFGWGLTQHAATPESPGEIGGRIANSRNHASYAMPLGRSFTFDDKLSVSGRVAVTSLTLRGVGYFGFFNSERHTWRVFSSMAFRIWEEDMLGQVMFDWMSNDWQARGAETAILLPPDGKVHTFSFDYDPDARADLVWRDKLLEKHVTGETGNGRPIELQGETFILERARQDEPNLTAEALHRRLIAARDQGLIEYFHRHDQHRWWKRTDLAASHGRVTLAFDDETPYVFWFDEAIRNAPVRFDRFGLFNICRYGTGIEVYFADLMLNGRKIDLSQDPNWIGTNNHASWTEPDFQGMNNFGWSQTNWAGKQPGELGGLIWRMEPNDPGFAYYADEIGPLTLDDPIEFEGEAFFVNGMTDASMYFGYFNKDALMVAVEQNDGSWPKASMLGVQLNDASSAGYYFSPILSSANQHQTGDPSHYTFTPSSASRHFSLKYDPKAQGGVGRVTYQVDGKEAGFDLKPAQRQGGALFDHFGMVTIRRGGNSVEIYFDDLNYTARRAPSFPPVKHPQQRTERPYPARSAGRQY